MAYITGDQVRARLRTVSETELPDTILAGTPYIPAGDAWLDVILERSERTYAELSEQEQTLAQAAEIAFIAHKVIGSAPVRGSKSGPVEIKPVAQEDISRICHELQEEWEHYLGLIGCSTAEDWQIGHCGEGYYD